MTLKYVDEYRDPVFAKDIIKKIHANSSKKIRLMEVCGTHTMSIFKHGIRSILPNNITLLSGPGCPVCVTAQNEIDAFIELSRKKDIIITTFGDLIRVPGSGSSLQHERANGRDIRIVYSSFDAIEIAKENPDKKIVFIGVGFETTAPTIAASVLAAKQMQINNYFVFASHKLTPPALLALMTTKGVNIDGFILPGHVSVITGTKAYKSVVEKYNIASAIAGFEPADILLAILMLIKQTNSCSPKLENAYGRAVAPNGNIKARQIMYQVYKKSDAHWRGIGVIPESGLDFNDEFVSFDAKKTFEIKLSENKGPKGCACGEILMGIKTPLDCSLYKKTCTPINPIGPCMVSSEGTCAAYYKYG